MQDSFHVSIGFLLASSYTNVSDFDIAVQHNLLHFHFRSINKREKSSITQQIRQVEIKDVNLICCKVKCRNSLYNEKPRWVWTTIN